MKLKLKLKNCKLTPNGLKKAKTLLRKTNFKNNSSQKYKINNQSYKYKTNYDLYIKRINLKKIKTDLFDNKKSIEYFYNNVE